jgi:hypothetical protein
VPGDQISTGVDTAVRGYVLLLAVASPLIAATGRHRRRRTRIVHPAALAVARLDMTILTIFMMVAPRPRFAGVRAVSVSLIRIGLTTRLLQRTLGHG